MPTGRQAAPRGRWDKNEMDNVRRLLSQSLPLLLILAAPPVMLYTLWGNPLSAAEDDVVYVYPLRAMVGQALREGRWPLANPLEATGSVLMADPQSAVMFPPTWLFAAMDGKLAYSLNLFLAFSTAGGGAYLYLRALRLVRPAAVFGAMAFMFCGFMVGHRVHLPMIQTAGFLPWGLWGIELTRRRGAAAFFVLVPVFFLAVAAGHWAILAFLALAWAAYLLLRGRPVLKAVGLVAAAAIVAGAMAAPQIEASRALLAQTTRQHIGYATVGENSFFPTAAVLAFFPMLMGNTTPNFFPQRWWGPWHLWEMLGYVGLVTLALAAAAVWALYRKDKKPPAVEGLQPGGGDRRGPDELTSVVRSWTWIGLGAGVWMLGYYLPTYWLVHKIPVLGVVRCPARMLVVVDMALAALAAVGVHGVMQAAWPRMQRLRRCVIVAATRVLPAAMVVVLALTAAVAGLVKLWPGPIPLPFVGGAGDALAALRPGNPAVWVPLALTVATALAVQSWVAKPAGVWLIIFLLLADLFFLTQFLDVPAGLGGGGGGKDPLASPAAAWLAQNGPREPYIVFGLNRDYRDRPAELLQPKVAQSLGVATLGSYGAWHSSAHARLFGFDTYGRCREWAWLVRRNCLLSLYGVRYLVAAGREFRDVIESVRIAPPPPQGANLLTGRWELSQARQLSDGALRLQTPFLWRLSEARQEVALEAGGIYRIALDARGVEDGAGNFLRAEVFRQDQDQDQKMPDSQYVGRDSWGLTVIEERIGPSWRHFEWTMRWPGGQAGRCVFRVYTMSERPIEVRHVELRSSGWETPVRLSAGLGEGQAVYRKVAEVPPVVAGDEPVAIYENLLCPPAGSAPRHVQADESSVERLRWSVDSDLQAVPQTVPDVGLAAAGGDPSALLWRATVPAASCWGLLGAVALLRRRRSAGGNSQRTL
jgi:hypothetical protein